MSALDDLPASVRQRVVALTAEVLPAVPGLSPELRRVAGFIAGRRARLGAATIGAELADPEFLGHVGTQLGAVHPLEESDDLDAATLGALLWLVRPQGWQERLDGVLAGLDQAPEEEQAEVARLRAENGRLRAEAEERTRTLRAENKTRLETLRVENADLRRKLGEARAQLRRLDAEVGRLRGEGSQALTETEQARERAETEHRRLRARIEELERVTTTRRAEDRGRREGEALRARLLLDTLVDAVTGLRRELALPRVDGSPADQIAAEIEVAAPGTGTAILTTATHLEHYLALPRVHVVLDGYNVTKSVWEDTSLETQRTRLLSLLPALAARTNAEVTVVFDAASVTSRPIVAVPRGVRVLFSPPGVIADDVIRDLVAAEPTGRPVLVVTADAAVVRDVRADGAVAVAPSALISLLARGLR